MKLDSENNNELYPEIGWHVPAGLFVRLLAIERFDELKRERELPSHAYWLLVLQQGSVFIHGKGQIDNGCVYLGQSGEKLRLRQQSSIIRGVQLVFEVLEPERVTDKQQDETAGDMSRLANAPALPIAGVLPAAVYSEAARLAEALCVLNENSDRFGGLRKQLLLQELLLILLENASAEPESAAPSIDAAIRYMEQDVGAPMTRELLARQAGMSEWHFAHRFKSRWGVGPMEYLGQLRLHKAKERLLQSRKPIKEIAKEVGFSDEFYFSRKFKQATGMPPSIYIKQSRERIAALSFPYTGHLLALGVMPWAGTVDRVRDVHREPHLSAIRYHLRRDKQSSPAVWQYNNRILQEARPEIILCSEWEASAVGNHVRASAPQVVVPWTDLDWRSQFRQIAEVVGHERQHEEWLDRYESQVLLTAASIRDVIGDASVSLLHILAGRLVVYGSRNGGAVLYEDLGLRAPYRWDAIDVYQEVTIEQLPAFTGEHLILIVDSDGSSLQVWEELRHSEVWLGLHAVRSGRVYKQPEMPWLDYSPYAHGQLLHAAERLLSDTTLLHTNI